MVKTVVLCFIFFLGCSTEIHFSIDWGDGTSGEETLNVPKLKEKKKELLIKQMHRANGKSKKSYK